MSHIYTLSPEPLQRHTENPIRARYPEDTNHAVSLE